jgi:hypothetical protein
MNKKQSNLSFFKITSLITVLVLLVSCGGDVKDKQLVLSDSLSIKNTVVKDEVQIIEPIQDEEVVVLEKNGITFSEIKAENDKEISLSLSTKSFKEGENQLSFEVGGITDYSIAVIENNYSISHYQKNTITKEFLFGNNVFLAFLTHPNGIAVKTNNALVLKNVLIDDEEMFNMHQPHLFYYLPNAKTAHPILDFCLVNSSISENGNKVKVTINETEFLISKWAAYQIEGLQNENNTIRIQLIDKGGILIDGPFNDSGERVFIVSKNS